MMMWLTKVSNGDESLHTMMPFAQKMRLNCMFVLLCITGEENEDMEVEKAHIPSAVFGSLKPVDRDADDENADADD